MTAEIIRLARELGERLISCGGQLAVAESCTAGLLSAAITEISGSSAYFERGFVVYSNEAKVEMLGVSPETIEQFGAVSSETAQAMVQGALKQSRASFALAITGIAGPTGGSPSKPVGTVVFAVSGVGLTVKVVTCQFSGDRHQVRSEAVRYALELLIEAVLLSTGSRES